MKTALGSLGMGFGIVGLAMWHVAAQEPFEACYNFNSVTTTSGLIDPTPTPLTAGITWDAFRSEGCGVNSTTRSKFSWRLLDIGAVDGDNDFSHFTGELNPAKFLEMTVTPEPGYRIDMDAIAFLVRRTSGGIRNYAVRSSLDNFAANLPAAICPPNPNLGVDGDNNFQWLFDEVSGSDLEGSRILLGPEFDWITGPLTFRFYGWNAEMTLGTFCIDDVIFQGRVAPVPEPAPGSLIALVGAVCAGRRLRRRPVFTI